MLYVTIEQKETGFKFTKKMELHHFSGVRKLAGTFLNWFYDYMKDCKEVGAKLHDSRLPLGLVIQNDDKVMFNTFTLNLTHLEAKMKLNNGTRSKRKFGKTVGIMIKHAMTKPEAMTTEQLVENLEYELALEEMAKN